MTEFTRPEMIVETDWLAEHLNDPDLRVVDCDLPEQYRRAHLPGAVNPPGDHYYKDPDDRRFIMQPAQFAAAISQLGIGNDTDVVGYDASGGLYATRLWWCLSYYGHDRVRVLNGGWNRWLQEGRPITMAAPKVDAGVFKPGAPVEDIRATAEYIMQAMSRPDVIVLDVRSDEEWMGTNNRGNKRSGRIPGSVHIEWLNNVESAEQGRRWKSPAELRAMFEAEGVTPDKEVITVCQLGIRASQAAMTLKLLGYDRVRDYDASFFEWGNRDDTPIVMPDGTPG